MNVVQSMRASLRAVVMGGISVFVTLFPATDSDAAGPSIYLIEENWEMVISEPDPAVVSPQVTFFNFPTSWEVLYFQLQMNYSADDDFSPGGFHVGALNDEVMIDEARSDLRSTLDTCYDTVRWTNVMAVFDGQLWFAVNDGQSDSWGYFGGPDYLVTMPAHWVSNLNSYDPQRSLANVDVGFGANRVQSIRLVDVKLVFTDGNIMTIPIDQSPSN